ncbi:MAG: hypothetical protein L0H14_12075, partial [Yaniella sp.]|uniref:N,N-dimethylformamidase beta subunit family domain-containing protein n=1 Tax=Yaniella sp. TaxID=2773929 RepID=UPI002655EAC0|nr:hypothetical protein [Yaniella sp.]
STTSYTNLRRRTLVDGHVAVQSNADGAHMVSSIKLRKRQWQLVIAGFAKDHTTLLTWDSGTISSEKLPPVKSASGSEFKSMYIAACGSNDVIKNVFDGRIASPQMWDHALVAEEIQQMISQELKAGLLVSVDFGDDQRSVAFTDEISGTTGELINMPTRGVTGPTWVGQVEAWSARPELYSAVHFHSDDLSDANWQITAEYPLPIELASGFYAIYLEAGDHEDWLTFIVTPSDTPSGDRLLILVPTLTYLAYANEPIFDPHVPLSRDLRDDWVKQQGLLSQYNWHKDGSGVAFASWRRPMMNLRPNYRYWLTGHPHGPGADLYLTHWLESVGIEYDMITDHDLDKLGTDALSSYRALATGCHPEYWTSNMLRVLAHFEEAGGRVAYLGGNGLAALVALHGEQPWVSEMRRRGDSVGLWDSDPGEAYFASDGHMGGSTRYQYLRGRELIGVDITGMGFADGQPYTKTSAATNPRASFVFKGVPESVIGDFGLHMGGAAGYEVDSADTRTGTPPHALVIASCDTVPPSYVQTEQRGAPRADMVFFETEGGGAVFSTSSITWTGSLSFENGNNPVSRITENVLRRFLDPKPFEYSRDLKGYIP